MTLKSLWNACWQSKWKGKVIHQEALMCVFNFENLHLNHIIICSCLCLKACKVCGLQTDWNNSCLDGSHEVSYDHLISLKYLKSVTAACTAIGASRASFGFWKPFALVSNFFSNSLQVKTNRRKCLLQHKETFCHFCKSFSLGENGNSERRP